MSFVARLRIPAVALLAALAPALLIAARSGPADPQLSITTDRLSYRLSRVGEYYHAKIVVTLANSSRDTVYLASVRNRSFGGVKPQLARVLRDTS